MSGGGSQLPVSALIRQGDRLQDVEGKRQTKDEYRRQKDLEEQRKAGQAPAMVDIDTGRDINPHIPEFIEKTPWYVPAAGPTLKHQRPHPERQVQMASLREWFPRGTTDNVAFKYRKGACENCGAMGHTKRDCFERPRTVGAKHTNRVLAADDHVLPTLKMGYDAKRDRWNGYDPADYRRVHEEYEQMEETRKLIRAQNMKDGVETPTADVASGEDGDDQPKGDEDMYAEDMAPSMSVDMDSRTRITVRNLRIREDTAKYLYSLDENSAHYDPKSRSMRENPFANVPGKEKDAAKFSGENFVRYTGEVVDANQAQVFAWQARCQGIDVHALAEPTKLEALKRAYEQKKTEHKSSVTQELIDKYGGQEHLDAPQKELLMAQTENYVEYNRTGHVIRGKEQPAVKSRYDEDVYIQNHKSVWGSYWRDGQWGYKCCYSLLKQSYCIGEKGIAMASAAPSAAPPANLVSSGVDNKDGTAKESNLLSSSPSESFDNEEEGSDSDVQSVDEEELARERERALEEDKRKKNKSDRRRRKRDRQKSRPKKSVEERRKDKEYRKKQDRKAEKSGFGSSSSSGSEVDQALDNGEDEDVRPHGVSKQLADAICKVKADEMEGKRIAELGDRKRKYNSHYEDAMPSELEIEAYQRTRVHAADPMASLMVAASTKNDGGGESSKKSRKH